MPGLAMSCLNFCQKTINAKNVALLNLRKKKIFSMSGLIQEVLTLLCVKPVRNYARLPIYILKAAISIVAGFSLPCSHLSEPEVVRHTKAY